MEVILLENIDELGTVGKTVKVKDGYARNYLIPQKLACLATAKNLNFYRTKIEAKQKKLAKARESALEVAERLSGEKLVFERRSRDDDARLFGSVTNADIAQALEKKGYDVDKRRITLSEAIKRLGEFEASVRLHPEVTAPVKVEVKALEEEADGGSSGKSS